MPLVIGTIYNTNAKLQGLSMNHLCNFVMKGTTTFETQVDENLHFFPCFCSSGSLANIKRSLYIKHIILQCLKCISIKKIDSLQIILNWYHVYMILDASQGDICSISVERQFFQLIVLQSHPGIQELMYVCSCLI